MIDIQTERLITLSEAAADVGGVHKNTVCRSVLSGVKGVKLESAMRGGRRMTSREALHRFVEQTTAAANGETPPTRTTRERQAAIRQAETELAKAGI